MFIRDQQTTTGARVLHVLHLFGLGFFTRWAIGLVAWSGLWILLIVGVAWLHLRREPALRGDGRTLETLAAYLIVYVYGAGSVWGFVGHFFLSDRVASMIGWAAGSPFQIELAFYHLAFGVMAGFAVWVRGAYWLALAIGKAVFLYGAAYVHLRDLLVHGNTAPGNAGFTVLVWGDILVPTAILAITIAYMRTSTARSRGSAAARSG